jgi:hypothetical protein
MVESDFDHNGPCVQPHHKFSMWWINNENHAKFFTHRFVQFIMCWKHVWHMDKCVNGCSTNLWLNKCHTNFTSSYKFVWNMFSMHDISTWNIQIMNDKFCMISIIKLWDAKFLIFLMEKWAKWPYFIDLMWLRFLKWSFSP